MASPLCRGAGLAGVVLLAAVGVVSLTEADGAEPDLRLFLLPLPLLFAAVVGSRAG